MLIKTVKVSSITAKFISFQSAPSFQIHSVRSKRYPLETASCKCKNSHQLTTENDAKEHDSFLAISQKKILKQFITLITTISAWSTSNLTRYEKKQNVRSKTREVLFSVGIIIKIAKVRKYKWNAKSIFEMGNVDATFIDKTNQSDPTRRK